MRAEDGNIAAVIYNQLKKNFDRRTLEAISEYLRVQLAQGEKPTEVITAFPLVEKQQAAFKDRLGGRTGHQEIIFKVDPDLLGGVVIRTSDKLFDASLKNDLMAIGRQLG